ncbi:MAG: FkbM family methyltransferase [Timaviella obliquedivisa GSE-PSE-MK23-08B]|jgi:FkbM family methyltransferase|nr:FkbM family methyltransferase [Timaviella obliquedivisa GSE-PSE-MK23-08B]
MIKNTIRHMAHSLGYRISKISDLSEPAVYPFIDILDLVIRDFSRMKPDVFFMQIGSHDGSFADPIHHLVKQHRWRGILVEPQPQVFQRLMQNYQGEDQLIFENAIVSQQAGETKFYTVQQREGIELPPWLEQSASLDRQKLLGALFHWRVIEKHPGIPDDFESLIKEVVLPTVTVEGLLRKHQVHQLDLLVIDTMGHDFEIIRSLPFDRIKPAVIHFEHSIMSIRDRNDCLDYLKAQGYKLAKVAVDTIAYLHAPVRHWTADHW